MATATIDELKITVTADTTKAQASIDSLVTTLSKLKTSSTQLESLSKLAEAMAAIKAATITKTNATNFTNVVNAANSLSAESTSNVSQLADSLNGLSDLKISRSIGTSLKHITSAAEGAGGITISNVSEQTDSLISRISKLGSTIKNVGSFVGAFKTVSDGLTSLIGYSNQYIEDMNLARTVLGDFSDQAEELAASYQKIYGIDSGAFLRSMGTFNSIAQGMGVASDNAYTMSKNLAQLSYDLASYYNISTTEAAEKVRAGLAGELEPLRAIGYDLSQARLQQEAYALGMTKSVSEMTQAEKAMLRYEAILNQVAWSHGDLAKTIASPSNMIRVFQENCSIAGRALGNIFLPALQTALPILIAIARAIATIGNMLADLTGGTQIAAMEFGTGSTDTSGLEDTAEAEDDVADSASGASSAVKELKRQLMGFDEINKFTEQSSGSGGSGSGSGTDTSGELEGFDLSNYDWIGEGLGDDIYNEVMSVVNRCIAAIKPLGDAFGVLFAGIKEQFWKLDLLGAFENMFVGIVSVVSNGVRSVTEVLTPTILAFNFPETIAVSFDLIAETCITLSSAINGVSTLLTNFVSTGVAPVVSWLGDKLRGAMLLVIDVMSDFGAWFRNNTKYLADLGVAAGSAAGFVLGLAAAIGDSVFSAAASIFRALADAVLGLLDALKGSQAAITAAKLLGAALAFNGVITSIETVVTKFGYLAGIIVKDSKTGVTSIKGISSATQTMHDKFSMVTGVISNWASGLYNAAKEASNAENQQRKLNNTTEQSIDKLNAAHDAVDKQAAVYKEAKAQSDTYGGAIRNLVTYTENFKLKQTQAKEKAAEFSVEINRSREILNNSKNAIRENIKSHNTFSESTLQAAKSIKDESTYIVVNSAKQAAATVKAAAFGVAQKAAAAGTVLLNAALNAFPAMLLVAALTAASNALQPLISGFGTWLSQLLQAQNNPILSFLGDMVANLFGVSDATGDVTDATEEANAALEAEQQAIDDNLDSIKQYEKQHDNLKTALQQVGMTEQDLAEYMYETGQSIEDITSSVDEYTNSVVNGFQRISDESVISAEELVSNLEANLKATREWSTNLKELMRVTGLDSSNAFIQEFESGGAKYNETVKELLANANGELDRFITVANETGSDAGNMLVEGFSSGSSNLSSEIQAAIASGEAVMDASGIVVYAKGENAGKAYTSGVATGASDTTKVTQAANTVGEAATEYGSHYNDALDAGRNFTGGFGDGIAASDMVALAVSKAKNVASQAVTGFNGGNGYKEAYNAGRNMSGGYGDGIKAAGNDAATKAKNIMAQAVTGLNGGTGYNKAKDAGKNLGGGFGDGLKAASSQATQQAKSVSTQVTNALKANTATARTSGSQIMQGFANGLKGYTSQATSAARSVSTSVSSALTSGQSTAASAGRTIVNNFVNGLRSSGSSASSAARSVASSANTGFSSSSSSAYSAGVSFGSGLARGINATVSVVKSAAKAVAYAAIVTVRTTIRQGSPSKVMAESGKWFDLGFAQGMDKYSTKVSDTAKEMTQEALDAADVASDMGATVGKAFGSGIAGGIDSQEIADTLAYANAATSQANSTNYGSMATGSYSATKVRAVSSESDVVSALSAAFTQGLVSMQLAANGSKTGTQGNTTIELKVDSQTLAKAVMNGNEGLARRGIVSFA